MCRKSPFPRCETHAKMNTEIKLAKMVSANKEYIAVKQEVLKHKQKGLTTHETLEDDPKVKKASIKYHKAQEEYHKAVEENNITLSSLNSLKNQIIDIKTHLSNPLLSPTTNSFEYNQERLGKLEETYRKRLNKRKSRIRLYDNIHHTVNGRKPSKYGTVSGVLELKEKQAKAFDNWMTALEENLPVKIVQRRAKEVQKAEKDYGHAVATLLHKRGNASNATSQNPITK